MLVQYRRALATPVFQGTGLKRGEEAQQAWLMGYLQAKDHQTSQPLGRRLPLGEMADWTRLATWERL